MIAPRPTPNSKSAKDQFGDTGDDETEPDRSEHIDPAIGFGEIDGECIEHNHQQEHEPREPLENPDGSLSRVEFLRFEDHQSPRIFGNSIEQSRGQTDLFTDATDEHTQFENDLAAGCSHQVAGLVTQDCDRGLMGKPVCTGPQILHPV